MFNFVLLLKNFVVIIVLTLKNDYIKAIYIINFIALIDKVTHNPGKIFSQLNSTELESYTWPRVTRNPYTLHETDNMTPVSSGGRPCLQKWCHKQSEL